jgi:GNAT superfamily N-acetyltransferase
MERERTPGRARRARPGDADVLIELQREYYAEEGLTHGAANMRALRRLLREPRAGGVWLLEWAADGEGATRAAGYVVLTLGWSLEWGGRDAFVDELYVRPVRRGRGLGALGLAAVEVAARRLGVRAVHLEVDATNDGARRLYERGGFRLRHRYQLMSKALR